jgi:uncharacterized membrane protein YfcA
VLGIGAGVGSWLGARLTGLVDNRRLTIVLGVLTVATCVVLALGIER